MALALAPRHIRLAIEPPSFDSPDRLHRIVLYFGDCTLEAHVTAITYHPPKARRRRRAARGRKK